MTEPAQPRRVETEPVPAEKAARGLALYEMHAAWATRQASMGVPFDPSGYREGSDYNLHSYDLDASGEEEDDFAAAAAEIMVR